MRTGAISTILMVLGALAAAPGQAAKGDLDPTFGQGGVAPMPVTANGEGQVLGILGDGSLLYTAPSSDVMPIEYRHSDLDGHPVAGASVVRLPDRFVPNLLAERPTAMRINDGGLLLGGFLQGTGALASVGGNAAVVKLDASGNIVAGYGQRGVATLAGSSATDASARAENFALQPDGRVLVASLRYNILYGDSVVQEGHVERLNADGSQDAGFGASPGVYRFGTSNWECCVPVHLQLQPTGAVWTGIIYDGLFYLSGSGQKLAAAPADSTRPADVPNWQQTAVAPDNGTILAGVNNSATQLVIGRLRPNGQADTSFGSAANGLARIAVDTITNAAGSAIGDITLLRTSGDGRRIYVAVSAYTPASPVYRSYVVRIQGQGAQSGTLDPQFARGGVALLADAGSFRATDVVEQASGAVVVGSARLQAIRLLATESPSPGVLSVPVDSTPDATEVAGSIQVRVSRTLGSNGAVSLTYETVATDNGQYAATPGVDFTAVSGRLTWADGDTADKIVTIPVLRDDKVENQESFIVRFSSPQGNPVVLANDTWAYIIDSNSPPPVVTPTPATPSTSSSGSGGGGGTAPSTLLLLAALLCLRRWACQHALRPSQSCAAVLLLAGALAAAPGQAAKGDLDPGFGQGGVAPMPVTASGEGQLLGILGDGSLLYLAASSNASRIEYRRTDLDGRPIAVNASPLLFPDDFVPNVLAARPTALRASDGGLMLGGFFKVAGATSAIGGNAAIAKLDANGRLVGSFGQQGVARLLSSAAANAHALVENLAWQPDGRLLVASLRYGGYFGDAIMEGFLERLNADGTQDSGFATNAGFARISAPNWDCCVRLTLHLLPGGTIFTEVGYDDEVLFSSGGDFLATAPADSVRPADVSDWQQTIATAGQGMIVAGVTTNNAQLVLARLRPDGMPDTSFGTNGNGTVRISAESLGQGAGMGILYVQLLRLNADEQHLYVEAWMGVAGATVSRNCLLRLNLSGSQSGALDVQFGRNGVARLPGADVYEVTDIVEQASGDVVVGGSQLQAIRLLGRDAPSPGLLNVQAGPDLFAKEVDGRLDIHVARTMGSSGTVSIAYETRAAGAGTGAATPGEDFTPVSGRLTWADGDTTDKIITVPLLRDDKVEGQESLMLMLSDPQGGAVLLASENRAYIEDSNTPPPVVTPVPATQPTTPATPVTSTGGGGGALAAPSLLLLAALLAWRRTRRPLRSIPAP